MYTQQQLIICINTQLWLQTQRRKAPEKTIGLVGISTLASWWSFLNGVSWGEDILHKVNKSFFVKTREVFFLGDLIFVIWFLAIYIYIYAYT